MRRGIATALVALATGSGAAAIGRPDFTPVIGSQVDLGLAFTDAAGETKPLSAFTAGKPTLILFGYHRCPNLCGVAELDLGEALKATGLAADAYSVVFVSVDSAETPADAAAARTKLRAGDASLDLASWHFLVGGAPVLNALEGTIGLTVAKTAQDFYVHPVAVSALTGDGRLSAVLSGLDYSAAELRGALVAASAGQLGTLGEHILLLCSSILGIGRYTATAINAIRILGLVLMLGLGGLVLVMTRRGRT